MWQTTHRNLQALSDNLQIGNWNTSLSTRISLQFSISIPPLSCGSSHNDNMRNGFLTCKKTGLLKVQETSFKGWHWQSDKEMIGEIFKQLSTEQQGQGKQQTGSSMDRHIVMDVWKIVICRWILVSIFWNSIACNSASKWPSDPSDRQFLTSKHIIVSNHLIL